MQSGDKVNFVEATALPANPNDATFYHIKDTNKLYLGSTLLSDNSPEIVARLKATVGHSSKNLLPITLESRPYDTDGNDFSVTVDKVAGTITINGTSKSSGATNIEFYTDTNGKLSGNFYITGGVTGCVVRAYDYDSQDANKWAKKWNGTTTASGSSSEHDSQEVQAVAGHKFGYRLRVAAGQSFTNAVIKPMLRDGSIADDTFEPYVMPTDEKKQDKPVVLWEAALNSTGVSEVAISSLADNVSNYSYLKVVVTNELETTITDQDAVMTVAEYDTAYIGRYVAASGAMLGMHPENGVLVFDRLFIWVFSEGTNITVRGLRNHNDTSTPPDVVPGVFIRKIIGIPK